MVRKYKPKIGTRKYGTKTSYSIELLDKAVQEIMDGKLGQREASRCYGIPRQTILNNLNKKHTKKVRKPVIFSDKEETAFVSHTVFLSQMGIPIGMYDLRLAIKNCLDTSDRKVAVFKNNMLGYEWGKFFLERHSAILKQCFVKNISPKRATVNEEIVNKFFDN